MEPEAGMPGAPASAAPGIIAEYGGAGGMANMNNRVNQRAKLQEELTKPFNPPTMSLEEFADREMARAQEREAKSAAAEEAKAEEDSDDEAVHDRKTKEAREGHDGSGAHFPRRGPGGGGRHAPVHRLRRKDAAGQAWLACRCAGGPG